MESLALALCLFGCFLLWFVPACGPEFGRGVLGIAAAMRKRMG